MRHEHQDANVEEATRDTERGTSRLNLSRRRLMRVAGGTSIGLAIGTGAFAGMASAHEVTKITFCECLSVTVEGELLLNDDPDDSGYRAVLYCDGTLVRRRLEGTQTRQHYSLLDDTEYDHEDCQIVAIEGETYPHGQFRICNDHCSWDCADTGLDAQPADWCDDPSNITSGGGAGGVDPNEDIVIECETDCLPSQDAGGCTPGFWCRPATNKGWWSTENAVGGYYTDDLIGDVFDSDEWMTVGGRGRNSGYDLADRTLHEAVCDLSGGPDLADAQSQLAGHATAALLNAAHASSTYPMTVSGVVDAVVDALDAGTREAILDQKDEFDEYNNLGCFLDAHGNVE